MKCPNCMKDIKYSKKNPYRPFCSKQCKMADLGAWFSEEYRLSSPVRPDEYFEEGITGETKTEYMQ